MKKFVLTLGIMLVTGLALYTWLGGFRDTKIVETQIPGYLIAGIDFKGKADDQKLGQLFDQIRNKNESGELPGALLAVYYEAEKADEGNIKAFLGVWVKDSSVALPAGFRFLSINSNRAVQATITAHFLVAPTPQKVEEQMKNFAKQRGLLLEKMFIERYISARNIVLEIPTQTKNK